MNNVSKCANTAHIIFIFSKRFSRSRSDNSVSISSSGIVIFVVFVSFVSGVFVVVVVVVVVDVV